MSQCVKIKSLNKSNIKSSKRKNEQENKKKREKKRKYELKGNIKILGFGNMQVTQLRLWMPSW